MRWYISPSGFPRKSFGECEPTCFSPSPGGGVITSEVPALGFDVQDDVRRIDSGCSNPRGPLDHTVRAGAPIP